MIPRWLLLVVVVAPFVHAVDNDVVTVPKDLMRFILGCQSADVSRQGAVPVYSVDIDEKEGTTSQKFGLLNMDELDHALRLTVDNDNVVRQIMAQVKEAVSASAEGAARQGGECNVENKINIALPTDEIGQFNDKMQELSTKNHYLLLEQLNKLMDFRFSQQSDSTEKMIRRKLNRIENKLNLVFQHLGVEVDDDDDNDQSEDDDDEGNDDDAAKIPDIPEGDFQDQSQAEPEPEAEPEAEPEVEPEAEPEPEPEPGCKCKDKTKTQTGSQQDEAKPETDMDPECEPASEPGQETGSEPEQEAGSEPGQETGSEPEQEAGSEPGQETGSEPGQEAGGEPGQEAGSEPGQETGSEPGQEAGGEPGQEAEGEPGQEAASEPGQEAASEPGQEAASEPGQEAASEPEQEAGSEPGQEAASEPGQEAGSEPGQEAGSEPGQEAGSEPGQEPNKSSEAASSENTSGESDATQPDTGDSKPSEEKEKPLESDAESITTLKPRPASKPTPMPVSELLVTTMGLFDSQEDDKSPENVSDPNDSQSDERAEGFERTSQKNPGTYDNLSLVRPLVRRPPLLANNPLPTVALRRRVPIHVPGPLVRE